MGAWIETATASTADTTAAVAPFMGAWIETARFALFHLLISPLLPLWEHGLKLSFVTVILQTTKVAPFMGAWIETMIGKDAHGVSLSCSLYGSMD